MASNQNLDEYFYLRLLEDFAERGVVPAESVGDPIYDYLVSTMHDAELQVKVWTDDVHARIFVDAMVSFVDACLKRSSFNFNRKQSEMNGVRDAIEWSDQKRKDGWQALIEMVEREYEKYGFRSAYYKNKFDNPDNLSKTELWESLYKDYIMALDESLFQQQREEVEARKQNLKKKLDLQLGNIPDYLAGHAVPHEVFHQAWGMMGGEWNEYDFERLRRLVELQKDYPVLSKVANLMGRVICPEGDKSMWVGTGNSAKIEHSAKSDIQGITTSNRIDSLLPAEMVLMADDDFQELFLLKYSTNKLQNFLHKSEQLNPNKRLERKRAKQAGPMIACIDTSGSMQGIPANIARSLILNLVNLSRRQHRQLFIIAFSVSARPIDAHRDRARLLDFFAHESTGNTDATKMLTQVITLLEDTPSYMSADVLLIGDFRMPLVKKPLLDKMMQHRLSGTYFYGLQLGEYQENIWLPHFDTIYKIGYKVPIRIKDK